MNFGVFQALGDRVEAEYRRLNYDDKLFPKSQNQHSLIGRNAPNSTFRKSLISY